jgi:hypothetical protein
MDDFIAGRERGGRQILLGLRYPYVVVLVFAASGELVEAVIRPSLFHPKSRGPAGPYFTENPDFQEKVSGQIASWQLEIGFRPGPILVQPFALPELSLGIEDLPRHLQGFRKQPKEFSEEEQREFPGIIDEWVSEGNFVLWWGTDYYLDKQGEVI